MEKLYVSESFYYKKSNNFYKVDIIREVKNNVDKATIAIVDIHGAKHSVNLESENNDIYDTIEKYISAYTK